MFIPFLLPPPFLSLLFYLSLINPIRDVTFLIMRGFARAYMAISAGRSILGKLFRVNATKSCERRSTSCICVDKRLWRSHCVFHIDGTSQRQKIRQRRKIAKSFHNYYCEEHRLLLSAARVLNDYVITFEIYLARSLFLRYAIKLIRMCFR